MKPIIRVLLLAILILGSVAIADCKTVEASTVEASTVEFNENNIWITYKKGGIGYGFDEETVYASYTGKLRKPNLSISYRMPEHNATCDMSDGIDYVIDWGEGNYIDAGTYTYTIIGMGEYSGSITRNWVIVKDIKDVDITKLPYLDNNVRTVVKKITPQRKGNKVRYDVKYNGKVQKPKIRMYTGCVTPFLTNLGSITYNLVEGRDYVIEWGEGNYTDAGTYTYKIKGINRFKGSVTKNFIIGKTDFRVTFKKGTGTYAYTGKVIKPAIKNVLVGGKVVDPKFYKIKYDGKDWTNIGVKTISIIPKGEISRNVYDGVALVLIIPPTPKIKSVKGYDGSFTVKYTQVKGGIGGYEIQYRKAGKIDWNSEFVKGKGSTSVNVAKLKSGKYQVRVRASLRMPGQSGCGTNYNDGNFSKIWTVKVK